MIYQKIRNWVSLLPIGFLYLFLFSIELFSFLSHQFPLFHAVSFVVLVSLFFILTLKNLPVTVIFLFLELFIGSKGYLFSLDLGQFQISIRIFLFLIVFFVGTFRFGKDYLRQKKIPAVFSDKKILIPFCVFVFFIFFGGMVGVFNNSRADVFLDINGYLYFAIFFIVAEVLGNSNSWKLLFNAFIASILWMFTKTYILLFLFSHQFEKIASIFYRWVRDTGVGEPTRFTDSFYRIFFQSHIFAVIGFFVFFLFFLSRKEFSFRNFFFGNPFEKKILQRPFFLSAISLSMVLVSFSRSFWTGLLLLVIGYFAILLFSHIFVQRKIQFFTFQKIKTNLFFLIVISITAFGIILVNLNFPVRGEKYFTGELIRERVEDLETEPAASSRWTQLPILISEIKQSLWFGHGFGKTITYKSSDPRNLEKNPEGWYLTYAFEWGYLDVLLKIGILGTAAYLWFLFTLFFRLLKKFLIQPNSQEAFEPLAIIFALLVVFIINIFTPYLNHPLGIGVVMIALARAICPKVQPLVGG